MTTDIKELVKRLRAHFRSVNASGAPCMTPRNPDGEEAALALEGLAGEVERLTANGIHTCHDECQRPLCKSYREIVAAKKHGELLNKMLGEAEAERDRLRPALEGMVHYATHNEGWQDDHPEYLEAARAALGGASARGEVADAAPAVCVWVLQAQSFRHSEYQGCQKTWRIHREHNGPTSCPDCKAPIKFTEAK